MVRFVTPDYKGVLIKSAFTPFKKECASTDTMNQASLYLNSTLILSVSFID
jgi:hypothetical protein